MQRANKFLGVCGSWVCRGCLKAHHEVGLLGDSCDGVDVFLLRLDTEGGAAEMGLAVQLVEELEVKARLVGEAVAAVQHEVTSEFGIDWVFRDPNSERKNMRKGTDEELVTVGNVIDRFFGATAK